jgi:hypothetical protein
MDFWRGIHQPHSEAVAITLGLSFGWGLIGAILGDDPSPHP